MKKYRIFLVVIITVLLGALLASCSGAGAVNSYPGMTVDQNTAYLAYQNGLFAVNLKDGSLLWRFPEKADASKSFFAPPAVTGSLIILGDYSNDLFGLKSTGDKQTPTQSWLFNPGAGHYVAAPLVTNNEIVAASGDHYLYALDLNGKLLWKFKTGNILWSQPVSDGNTVYLSAMDHNLYAIRLSDGSLIWKKDLGSSNLGQPILGKDGTVYVVTLEAVVFAVNRANGAVLWQTAALGGQVWASPVEKDNVLYFGSSDGNAYAISSDAQAANRVLWKVPLGDPIIAGEALLSDGILFPTENGIAYKLGFKGEKSSIKLTVNGKLYTTPVITKDLMILAIAQGDKVMTAYNMNGNEQWSFTLPK